VIHKITLFLLSYDNILLINSFSQKKKMLVYWWFCLEIKHRYYARCL